MNHDNYGNLYINEIVGVFIFYLTVAYVINVQV